MKTFTILIATLLASTVSSQPVDPRFLGKPSRDLDGSISRSTYQKAQFVQMHPCPATGKVSGACPGWSVDHIIPLSCGGLDTPVNMQWLPLTIKSCAGTQCKDRWERKVYKTTITC